MWPNIDFQLSLLQEGSKLTADRPNVQAHLDEPRPQVSIKHDQASQAESASGMDKEAIGSGNNELSLLTGADYAVSGVVASTQVPMHSGFNQLILPNESPFTEFQIKQLRAQCLVYMSLRCELSNCSLILIF